MGTSGNEELDGTSGPDVIVGLGGADRIDGRGGDDWICLERDGAVDDRPDPRREAFIDGGRGADHIRGGRGPDSLTGGDGPDVIHGDHGGGGNELSGDFLGGNAGRDVLFGGEDGDFARDGGGRDLVYLGPGGDVGTGMGGNDVIFGGPGADGLGGVLGAHHVDGVDYPFTRGLGERGEDAFFGGKGDDWFGLGRGRYEISGGSGSDGIVIRTKWTSSFEADLHAGRAVGGGSALDTLSGVENAHAYGAGDVAVAGNKSDNSLFASSSSTGSTLRIEGRGGDDSIRIYPLGAPEPAPSGGAGRVFGDGGNDRLWAGCGETTEVLNGGRGNDRLTACAGPERLFGGSGDDVLRVTRDDGRDLFDGGEGRDLISYRSAGGPASVDLGSGEASSCGPLVCEVNVLLDVEDVEGTAFEGDSLTGDAGDNDLHGLGGNDVLSGMAGDDRLFGDEGDDLLDGGEGANSNDGGEGTDNCMHPSSAEGAADCEALI